MSFSLVAPPTSVAPVAGFALVAPFDGSSTATTGDKVSAGSGTGVDLGTDSSPESSPDSGVVFAVSSVGSESELGDWFLCLGGAVAGLASGSATCAVVVLLAGADAFPFEPEEDSGVEAICGCGGRARRVAFEPSPTAFIYISARIDQQLMADVWYSGKDEHVLTVVYGIAPNCLVQQPRQSRHLTPYAYTVVDSNLVISMNTLLDS